MSGLLTWDLDDTLVDNVHDYADPILDACRLIIHELGAKAPHVSALIALEQEIDKKRVGEINPVTGKPFGYTMERFPGTMVETYRAVCIRSGVSPKLIVETELYRIGMTAFDRQRYRENIKPGALNAVRRAVSNGWKNVLLTKGDPQVQRAKIEALTTDVDGLFAEVVIVELAKTSEVFQDILAKHGSSGMEAYSIGNDYNKDIAPALCAGLHYRGIWIPVETWETIGTTDALRKAMSNRCVALTSLIQLPHYLSFK